ncbi:glycolipid transfer protein [Punctularia strigosozonata HHB-11173 SS5]|uniref:glycolipid transfer protein n=1 Tax=Punctularia strigosozonata (strain HHB-11173) TaxID=741275 RepID=UPI0004417661|nr:glycolipid transfer protein [Punctularia strigosozonata HHB-11173 SS5]EIN14749.1 glycolipid transfer protein [Punctularia strigosozonata HHB-11173 SS5]
MAPYFETAKSFADVPIGDDGVDTVAFLEASDALMNMFDLLGIGVFTFVQHDLRMNISGVRHRHDSHTDRSPTLEKLVLAEHDDGHKHATGCLVRLLRHVTVYTTGLAFTLISLRNTQAEPKTPLHASFKKAYDVTLKHHHKWAIRNVVYIALRATPHRADFYARISESSPTAHDEHARLDVELTKWLAGLDIIVRHMKDFLERHDLGKVTI